MTTENEKQNDTTPDFFDVAKTLWPEKDTDAPSVIKGEETLERLYSSPAALEKMGLVKKEDCVSIDGLTAAHMMGYHSRDEDFAKLKAELAEAKRKLDEATLKIEQIKLIATGDFAKFADKCFKFADAPKNAHPISTKD